MTFPSTSAYPKSFEPKEIRAAAILPALGAWDTPAEFNVSGFVAVNLFITYTRNALAVAGAVDIQIQSSPRFADAGGVQNWFIQSVYDSGVVAAGADTVSNLQREYMTFTSQGATAETFVLGPYQTDYIERLRVTCRESGEAANPGDVHIVGLFYEG